MYYVEFKHIESNKGFILGYKTANHAKELVSHFNERTTSTKIVAVYLGNKK